MTGVAEISSGLMADGEYPFVPGVNCWDCGRFVGRDGWISIYRFESSFEVSSVAGQCARCVRVELAREATT